MKPKKLENAGIYVLTCVVNDKSYVGKDSNLGSRPKIHFSLKRTGCWAIHNAIKKYGKDAFKVELIPYFGISEDALNAVEIWKIKQLNSLYPNGYNLTEGGDGGLPLAESRRKISEARRGKKLSKEHRQKLSKAHSGKKLSDAHRKKIGDGHRGKKMSIESVRKRSGEKHFSWRKGPAASRLDEIWKLLGLGWSHDKIADYLGVHQVSLSRLIKRHQRKSENQMSLFEEESENETT